MKKKAKSKRIVTIVLEMIVGALFCGHAGASEVVEHKGTYAPPLHDSVTVALAGLYNDALNEHNYIAMRDVAVQLIPYYQSIKKPLPAASFAQQFLQDIALSNRDSIITRAYYTVGVLFFRVGLFSVSRDYFLRMQTFKLDRQIECRLYYALAETSRQMATGDVDVDAYYRKSGEIAYELKDSVGISSAFFGQSQVLFESLDMSLYPFILTKGLRDTIDRANALLEKSVLYNPLSYQSYLGLAVNYAVVQEFGKAYGHLSTAQALADAAEPEQMPTDGSPQLTPTVHNSYAFTYLLDNKTDNAILFARQTYDYSTMFDKKGDMKIALMILYEAYKQKGDFRAANEAHEEIMHLQKILATAEREQEVIALQIKFDSQFNAERLQNQLALTQSYYLWGAVATCLFGASVIFLVLYTMSHRKQRQAYKKLYQRSLEWANIKPAVPCDDSRLGNPTGDEAKLSELHAFIESEKIYTDHKLTVANLAEKVGLNPSALSEMINRNCDKNFNTFINEFRVKEAIQLIESSDEGVHPISTIMQKAGFADRSTYSRSFKKTTGMSVTEYISERKK